MRSLWTLRSDSCLPWTEFPSRTSSKPPVNHLVVKPSCRQNLPPFRQCFRHRSSAHLTHGSLPHLPPSQSSEFNPPREEHLRLYNVISEQPLLVRFLLETPNAASPVGCQGLITSTKPLQLFLDQFTTRKWVYNWQKCDTKMSEVTKSAQSYEYLSIRTLFKIYVNFLSSDLWSFHRGSF
jgi:hypothetical protein